MAGVVRSNPRAFERISARLKELDGVVAKAGWFESARYPNGTPVAAVAIFQEFGTSKIPPRPFMRPTSVREKRNWIGLMEQGARAVMKGNIDGLTVLDSIAAKAAAEIARSITLVHTPPLKPATIARRLAKHADKATVGLLDKPLIDTGRMYETVTHTVERENG